MSLDAAMEASREHGGPVFTAVLASWLRGISEV